jgi:lysozyme family protein
MPAPKLTDTMRNDYRRMFDLARVRPEHAKAIERWCDKVLQHQGTYQAIGAPLGIPWFFIAVVHMRESDLNFRKHLHNGDPLTARTVRVPAGRPKTGTPPFTFEYSANDALVYEGLNKWTDWSLPGLLYKLEAYNGWGYHYRNLPSPYLWSFTNHYSAGKFIKDGVYDPNALDAQCGTATLLRRLAERQDIQFADEPDLDSPPQVVPYASKKPTDPSVIAAATRLQEWLASHPGITLKIDGWPGQRTSNAYKAVTGQYLPGDPRA